MARPKKRSGPSQIDQIRARIASINGTFDYMDVAKEFPAAHVYLRALVDRGEVEIVGRTQVSGSRSRTIYRLATNISPKKTKTSVSKPVKKQQSPWANVFPEYFTAPNLTGNVRAHKMRGENI